MVDLSAVRALTFDCYGTLIDWERGILAAVRPLLAARRVEASDSDLLALYARLEAQEESGSYRRYRDVLARVMAGIGTHYGVHFDAEACASLAHSIDRWPAFPDTRATLLGWASSFQLVVCSNVDDDLFAATLPHLGCTPHFVVTAEYCRSYKPDPKHFRVALALLGLRPDQVLHIAESRRHDIAPARAMGMRTAWVNRHAHREGSNASGIGDAVADVVAPDLVTLAALMRS